jgi:hypothetical protein
VTNPWKLYQARPAQVLGFHGTEKKTVDELTSGGTDHLKKSEGKLEWLGHGIYFWENDPQRGLEWAQDGHPKAKIKDPDVVGAILDLGLCLDLTTRTGLDEVEQAYKTLESAYAKAELELPINNGGEDRFKRELDCQVIEALHFFRLKRGQPSYDSVRAPFREDKELYTGAGFHRRNHVQIAILNPDCIKGYFRPIRKGQA